MTDTFDRLLQAIRDLGLRRDTDDKWIAGVCSGLAERLRVDPLIVRAGFIVLGFLLGAGVTLYLIAWCLLPDRDDTIVLERAVRRGDGASIALVIITVLVIVTAPVSLGGSGWFFGLGGGWGAGPVVPLIVAGVCVWAYWSSRSTGPAAPLPPSASYSSAPSPAHPAQEPRPSPSPSLSPRPRPRHRRLGAGLSVALLGLAAAIAGATTLLLQQTRHEDVAGRVGLAAALAVLGLGLFAAGLAGLRAGLLMLLGWLAALVTAASLVLPTDLQLAGPYGDQTWTPTTAAMPAGQPYELSAGDATLDLTRLPAPTAPTASVTLPAKVSVGQLRVILPPSLGIEIRGRVGLGAIEVDPRLEQELGWQSEVGGSNVTRTIRLGAQPATLVIDARVGIGQLTIDRPTATSTDSDREPAR